MSIKMVDIVVMQYVRQFGFEIAPTTATEMAVNQVTEDSELTLEQSSSQFHSSPR